MRNECGTKGGLRVAFNNESGARDMDFKAGDDRAMATETLDTNESDTDATGTKASGKKEAKAVAMKQNVVFVPCWLMVHRW